jgi:DNA-directed RNA polymerase specialized sigma24 family protein
MAMQQSVTEKDIADMFGISPATLRKRLERARERLDAIKGP